MPQHGSGDTADEDLRNTTPAMSSHDHQVEIMLDGIPYDVIESAGNPGMSA